MVTTRPLLRSRSDQQVRVLPVLMDRGTSRPRFFTPAEVAAHDTVDDLWVSCLGRVCDLSPLVTRYRGE